MERHRAEEVIKKGPWTAEEDEVLIKFVNKYGPKEWSSIRSMGLLPRTGKSCRLRWVNKLRPNLKIGCKFSAEEERMVIDLQARFGNKWAAIASYLPGRTDNDVKNFWSTRQKRLARILQSPTRTSKSQKIKGKALAVHEIPTLKAPELNLPQMKEEPSSSKCQSCSSSSIGDPEMLQIMPLPLLNLMMMTPNLINVDSTTLPLLDIIDTDHHNKSSTQTPLQLSFTHLPLLPESHDPVLGGLIEANFLDVFASAQQVAELETVSQLNFGSPFLELEGAGRNDGRADGFFDELPADMFDYLEPIPGSSLV